MQSTPKHWENAFALSLNKSLIQSAISVLIMAPLTRAQLRFKACTYLQIPPSLVLDVIPNCARNKYFIHWLTVTKRGNPEFHVDVVVAKELEKQKL